MDVDANGLDEVVRHGFAFVLWQALIFGGIYLIITGYPSDGYALVDGAALWGVYSFVADCCGGCENKRADQ